MVLYIENIQGLREICFLDSRLTKHAMNQMSQPAFQKANVTHSLNAFIVQYQRLGVRRTYNVDCGTLLADAFQPAHLTKAKTLQQQQGPSLEGRGLKVRLGMVGLQLLLLVEGRELVRLTCLPLCSLWTDLQA